MHRSALSAVLIVPPMPFARPLIVSGRREIMTYLKSSSDEQILPVNDSGAGRLIIVCGLPGSGKTTLAKWLEVKLRAVRLAPDEWMDALSINLYDEASRERVETLQWEFGRALLKLGLVVIIE